MLEQAAQIRSGSLPHDELDRSACSSVASTTAWSMTSSAMSRKIAKLERELELERRRRVEVERVLHEMGLTADSLGERRRHAQWTENGLEFHEQR